MWVLGGQADELETAREKLRVLLASGAALAKFDELVVAQGGQLHYNQPDCGLPQASIKEKVAADRSGFVTGLDALKVGHSGHAVGSRTGKGWTM
jgi:pyrimidine-nucleoside phosphorylase